MATFSALIDDVLERMAGDRFDPHLVAGSAIDLGPQAERVRGIAHRLNAHRDGRPKQALVLWTPGYSAVTRRGAWIYIAKGLAEKLSDDAVAFILAHELGHHDLRHLTPAPSMASLFLGQSQRMEFQADRYGLALSTRAGFAASGAREALDPEFWGAEPRSDTSLPEPFRSWMDKFRRSHPPLPARISALGLA